MRTSTESRRGKPNQILLTQGELADTILFIQQGRVRLSDYNGG